MNFQNTSQKPNTRTTTPLLLILLRSKIVMVFLLVVAWSISYELISHTTLSTYSSTFTFPSSSDSSIVFPISFFDVNVHSYLYKDYVNTLCGVYLSSYFNTQQVDYFDENTQVVPPTFIGTQLLTIIYGHWSKYIILDRFLSTSVSDYIREDDFVFFSDGLDVMVNGDLQQIKQIYFEYLKDENFDITNKNQDWPLLVNSEKNKWPPLELFKGIKNINEQWLRLHYVQNYPQNKKYCPPNSPFIYLNSGMYFGRKRDVKSYLKKSFEMVEDPSNIFNDDQATLQTMHVSRFANNQSTTHYPIIGDCKAAMGLPTYLACDHINVGPNFHDPQSTCKVSNNLEPKKTPLVVHSNGPKCGNFCPCVHQVTRHGRLRNYLEKEMKLQRVASLDGLKNLPKLRVLFYHSTFDKIKILELTRFCSAKSLFEISPYKCMLK
ncbi:hypothetical protein C9374_008196 [Naegleria lovaniensis]|uniref:Uncharacterized protein n=1 Tax=Naegleria lovaniensis TaxID=51637 RepID=A0AA88GJL0_NAELO|nr:uncharacterized protein C9374_008196 [Naegleria lovaniensis]KAG2378557.1 hypothetical protein C9374_008196 [Naegleria lovaniensis]